MHFMKRQPFFVAAAGVSKNMLQILIVGSFLINMQGLRQLQGATA